MFGDLEEGEVAGGVGGFGTSFLEVFCLHGADIDMRSIGDVESFGTLFAAFEDYGEAFRPFGAVGCDGGLPACFYKEDFTLWGVLGGSGGISGCFCAVACITHGFGFFLCCFS